MSDTQKPCLVVVSKAKAFAKEKGASLGMDAVEILSAQVEKKLAEAAEKAKADGRKVIKPRDLE